MTKVKMCGIATEKDALQASVEGADFIGLIVDVSFSEDSITQEEAKTIIKNLPLETIPVMVTYHQKANPIIKTAKKILPKIIQLHNDITNEEIKKIKKALPKVKLTKAIHVTDETAIKKARSFPSVDYLLLDTKVGKKKGGTGVTHNWEISANIVKAVKQKVFLAGGLNPENVKEAIQKVKPFAVDVNSGVKMKAKTKDPEKVKAFIAGAK